MEQASRPIVKKPRVTLNESTIKRLALPPGKADETWWDSEIKGFGYRKRSSGHANYVLQYQLFGVAHKLDLGDASQLTPQKARMLARAKRGQIDQSKLGLAIDPAAERDNIKKEASAPAPASVGVIIAAYLEAKKDALRPATYYATDYYLQRLWKPVHGLSVDALTEMASRALIASTARAIAKQHGAATSNRARACLSAMFAWGVAEGLCASNPVVGTNKQEEAAPRDRVLSDEEAAAVWLGLPDGDYGNIVRLLMLTGCRRDEIGGLRWSEIDLDAASITLPASRTKNARAHVVPLPAAALEILKAVPRRADRDCVFGSGVAGFAGWSKAKVGLDDKVELTASWTLHDLRRTVRTGLGMLGVAPHVAEAVLNHLPPKLIRTYDRNSYETEKRAALELWAGHLAVAIAKASGANVTELKKRKPAS